jgi:hypothetical protein
MDFHREQLTVTLTEEDTGHEHTCFACDLFSPRPPFQEILAFQDWAGKLQESLGPLMARKTCSVQWLGLFVDEQGAWLLAAHKSGQAVNNLRQSLKTLLSGAPKEQQKQISVALRSLRPLDEEDTARIEAWQSLESLRPKVRSTPPAATPAAPQTLDEFLQENDYSEEEGNCEEQQPPPQTLALRQAAGTLAVCGPSAANLAWTARAQTYATVLLAQTGPSPELSYIRCYKESRRHLLLARRLRAEGAEDLASAVRLVARMAKDGCVPGHGLQRTNEFMKRCVSALQVVNPRAETDPSKLPREEQTAVRRALGDEKEPYQGCLSEQCIDKETVWATEDLGDDLKISRCSSCKMPKAMGRTLNTSLSLIAERMKAERGGSLRKSLEDLPPFDFRRSVRQRLA